METDEKLEEGRKVRFNEATREVTRYIPDEVLETDPYESWWILMENGDPMLGEDGDNLIMES